MELLKHYDTQVAGNMGRSMCSVVARKRAKLMNREMKATANCDE